MKDKLFKGMLLITGLFFPIISMALSPKTIPPIYLRNVVNNTDFPILVYEQEGYRRRVPAHTEADLAIPVVMQVSREFSGGWGGLIKVQFGGGENLLRIAPSYGMDNYIGVDFGRWISEKRGKRFLSFADEHFSFRPADKLKIFIDLIIEEKVEDSNIDIYGEAADEES